MTSTSQSYAEIIRLLGELSQVLLRLNISQGSDRIRLHTLNLQKLEQAFRENRIEDFLKDPQGEERQEKLIWSLVEGLELGEIIPTLYRYPDDVLRDKLTKALQGPADPKMENANSNLGRNTVFELNLGSRLLSNGVKFKWSKMRDPYDIVCEIEEYEVHIQCKRPFLEKAVEKNIIKARKQLVRDLGSNHRARGFIGISLSRVFNNGREVFITDTEAGTKNMFWRSLEVIKTCERIWKTVVDPRIIGIIFHVAMPAMIRQSKHPLGLAQSTVVCNLPVDIGNAPLIRRLTQLLSNSPDEVTYAQELPG